MPPRVQGLDCGFGLHAGAIEQPQAVADGQTQHLQRVARFVGREGHFVNVRVKVWAIEVVHGQKARKKWGKKWQCEDWQRRGQPLGCPGAVGAFAQERSWAPTKNTAPVVKTQNGTSSMGAFWSLAGSGLFVGVAAGAEAELAPGGGIGS